MKSRSRSTAIIFMLALIVLAACGPSATEVAPTQEPMAEPTEEPMAEPTEEPMEEPTEEPMEEPMEMPDLGTIRVGYLPITGFVPFFVAQDLGYFEEQGLTVEMEGFRTGDDMIAPLSLGDLDVGGGETGPALFNAINLGLDVRVVGALASQPPGYGGVPLLVRTELLESGEVSEVGDLQGRNVAVNVYRGMAEYLLAKALERADLTVDDVNLVSIPFPEIPAGLDNEAVDAAILPHPLASLATRPGEEGEDPIAGVLIPGDEITDAPQNGAIYFGTRLLDPENHEVSVRFMMAVIKAARDMQGEEWRQNDEIVNAILNYTTVPEPAVRNGVIYFFDPNGELHKESTADIQAYHVGRGYTDLEEPLPLEEIILDDFRLAAVERLGEYQE
jgi:NitT/TauT family transport system substrate-binding protein